MRNHSKPIVTVAAALLAVLALAAPICAQVITPDPSLPTLFPTGQYTNPAAHPTFFGPGFTVTLSDVSHKAIAVNNRIPSGPDEIEQFESQMDAIANIAPFGTFPTTAQGPVMTIVHGKIGNLTGTFDTEMLSMSLSGVTPLGPFMIRESPTLPSLGRTSITDVGGGLYRIDSFFDVFTELSVDGGQTWIPDSNGPDHMVLGPVVPEPSVCVLAGLAAGLLTLRRARCFGRRR